MASFEPEFIRPVPPMLPIADSEVRAGVVEECDIIKDCDSSFRSYIVSAKYVFFLWRLVRFAQAVMGLSRLEGADGVSNVG